MRVAKLTRPRYYVELTADDLRSLVFDTLKVRLPDEEIDTGETIYIQLEQGEGLSDEDDGDMPRSDYQLEAHCHGTQVRFVVLMEDIEEVRTVDAPAPTLDPAQPTTTVRRRGR